jgi:dipeptidase E
MKLYLSSYRIPIPEALLKLLNKDPEFVKVAIIPNAKDYYATRARNVKIRETTEYLKLHKLNGEVVDLQNYDNNPEELREKLSNFQLLWVSGGNTFCLRYQMKHSGLELILPDMLKRGLVYAGESAGACVIGNTLHGHETVDDPEFAEEVIWEGLNILSNFILPHTDNPMFSDDIKAAREMHKDDPTVLELADNQAYVVDGISTQVLQGNGLA